jgi:hypothetical protein
VLGGVLLRVRREPQAVAAWSRGAEGEERLGARLDRLASADVHVLHDRRIPRSRANIDHIVVAPSGVYVVDTKHYQGRVEVRHKGGWFRADDRLYVRGRDRSKLIGSAHRQAEVVASLVPADAVVRPVLCFVGSDWPLVGGSFSLDRVLVTWPRNLAKRIRGAGPLAGRTTEIADRLGSSLRPACPA